MKVLICGAGAVGQAIARELILGEHEVTLVDRSAAKVRPESLPDASWELADACEINDLERLDAPSFDAVVAATGDDQANLVLSLLAKTEMGVSRVIARVNHEHNEWLFTEQWGVDVAVSTPKLLAALVEEAVSVGRLVPLMSLRQGGTELLELTLPPLTNFAGKPCSTLRLPRDTALVAILRGGAVLTPAPDVALEGGDELLFVAHRDAVPALGEVMGLASNQISSPTTFPAHPSTPRITGADADF